MTFEPTSRAPKALPYRIAITFEQRSGCTRVPSTAAVIAS